MSYLLVPISLSISSISLKPHKSRNMVVRTRSGKIFPQFSKLNRFLKKNTKVFKTEIKHEQENVIHNLFVKTLTGRTICCTGLHPSSNVIELKQQIQRQEGIPPEQQRIIHAGKQLEEGKIIRDYNITDMATVHLVLRLRGMISTFAGESSGNDEFSTFLNNIDIDSSTPRPCQESITKLANDKNALLDSTFESCQTEVLHEANVKKIKSLMDFVYEEKKNPIDLKIVISKDAFNLLLGADTSTTVYDELMGLYNDDIGVGYSSVKVALRRTSPTLGGIPFHLDAREEGGKTMQICLNDQEEYTGGRLVFLTEKGIEIPERKKGMMTKHTDSILHGVTRLHLGIRYSLFVVGYDNGLGDDESVFRVGRDYIEKYQKEQN